MCSRGGVHIIIIYAVAAAAEAAVAVNFVGLHVRCNGGGRRRRCRRRGEWASEAGEAAAVWRLHQCVAGGDCVADDVVADRRLARRTRVSRRVAHRVQCGWWRRRRVEVMVRRPRMNRPELDARVADAAAAGGDSPEASS